jgi:sensor histidine kinase regulating citrate/malate metabolism
MEDIFKVLRNERHDFLNHLQVISGLLQLKKPEQALDYVAKVTQELYSLGKVMRIQDLQIATALLLSNYEANQKGISLQFEISSELDQIALDSLVFSQALGQLLQTLLGLCQKVAVDPAVPMKIGLKEDDKGYIFEIICHNLSLKENDQVLNQLAQIKEIAPIKVNLFDTDKYSRIYITLPKAEGVS